MNKKTIILLLGVLTLFACGNIQRQQSEIEEVVKMRPTDSVCVAYVECHLDGFNNDITREKIAKAIQQIIIDTLSSNTDLLYSLPLKYESVIDNGKKYIVRFSSASSYHWNDRKKCDINIWFYSIVGNEIMSILKDKEIYYLSKGKLMGKVNDKIELPNGDTFDHNPHVALIESPLDTTFMIGLGGLFMTDIELKE